MSRGANLRSKIEEGHFTALARRTSATQAQAWASPTPMAAALPPLYHLVPKSDWEALEASGEPYFPATYEADGFTHMTEDASVLLTVANHFCETPYLPLRRRPLRTALPRSAGQEPMRQGAWSTLCSRPRGARAGGART